MTLQELADFLGAQEFIVDDYGATDGHGQSSTAFSAQRGGGYRSSHGGQNRGGGGQ